MGQNSERTELDNQPVPTPAVRQVQVRPDEPKPLFRVLAEVQAWPKFEWTWRRKQSPANRSRRVSFSLLDLHADEQVAVPHSIKSRDHRVGDLVAEPVILLKDHVKAGIADRLQ